MPESKNIIVFGHNGQVATALRGLISDQAIFFSSAEANFLDPKKVIEKLELHKPRIVINASAYTNVDKAEDEKDICFSINSLTPSVISKWCKDNNSTLIHYSTDYVFNGKGDRPWLETDPTEAINWYGHSKLEGEKNIIASKCLYFILRISWVHSPWGSNFPKTILRLAKEKEELKVVNDQWGAPTDARDVAKVTAQLCELIKTNKQPDHGIYHLRFSDYMTWYAFAKKIIDDATKMGDQIKVKNIIPILSEDFQSKAKRPKNSRLGSLYNQSTIFNLESKFSK